MNNEVVEHWVRTKLWDQVPVAISVIDRDFRIVQANRSFEQSFGPWRDRACHAVYKGRDTRCVNCGAAQTFADGQVRVREEQGVERNGNPTYYLVHMVPLLSSTGEIPCVIEMSTDITQTKALEREKIEAERLAAVGQTVAGLAHGIKNVLMGLEGGMYVGRSGMERGDPERLAHGWEMLEDNIGRISFFVTEFLEFARGRTPTVLLVDPNRIASDVFKLFVDRAAMADIQLQFKPGQDIAWAFMDEAGINDCVANLVSNAVDACAISDKANRQVYLSTFEEQNTLIIQVRDDGAGMDYEVKKKVFTNFFSTKGSDKGTGLGLLTTRKIVQEHGGRVSFESSPGVGSKFRLEFPRDRLPTRKENEPAE
jgi:PAS domain S-box-containing protein